MKEKDILRSWKDISAYLNREIRRCIRWERELGLPVHRIDEGFFYCAGGQDRLAVDSEEHVWGCDLFGDYFRDKEKLPEYREYFFGDLDTLSKEYKKTFPRISSNYARLAMDNYETSRMKCLFCENLERCTVCPIAAAFSGLPLGKIPSFVCEIQKIRIKEQGKFKEEILEGC